MLFSFQLHQKKPYLCRYSHVKIYRISGRLHKEKNLSSAHACSVCFPPNEPDKSSIYDRGFTIPAGEPAPFCHTLQPESELCAAHMTNSRTELIFVTRHPEERATETAAAISGCARPRYAHVFQLLEIQALNMMRLQLLRKTAFLLDFNK